MIAAELMKPDWQQTGLVVSKGFWFDVFSAIGMVVSSLVLGFICTSSKLSENPVRYPTILPNLFVHAFYRNLPVWDFFKPLKCQPNVTLFKTIEVCGAQGHAQLHDPS